MLINTPDNQISIDDINGLICIDCWEIDSLKPYYQNLENNINFSRFDSIIVANYELALDSLNDISQYNTLEEYSWTNYNSEILLSMISEARERKTSQILQKHFKKHAFVILTINGLVHHIENVVPHINNWLIIGGTWGMCTNTRPINFTKLAALPYNFYITNWSMYSESIVDLSKDIHIWENCNNGLYKLHYEH